MTGAPPESLRQRDYLLRFLDTLLLVFAALLAWVLLTWRWTLRLPTARPEDVLLAILAVLAVRWWLRPLALPAIRPGRAVAVGVVAYALIFSFIAVTRHYTFRTHALDLGQYAQSIWKIARGQEPYDTVLGWHAWGNHFSPIFYLFVPVSWVWPDPVPLLLLQSVFLGLGAVPLYLLARPRVGPGPASALAILYLMNPSLHGINIRDFHPAALAIPLLLTAMYAAESGRPWLFGLAALLTLTTREDAAIPVVGLGLWLAVARRRWASGAMLILVSLAWLFATVHWLMPFFRDDRTYPYLAVHYRHLGDSLGEILLSPILRPRAVLGILPTLSRVQYLVAVLAPLGFLPLLAPLSAIGALPALAQNLLANYPVLLNYRAQYQSFVLPFLFVGAVGGLEGVQRARSSRWLNAGTILVAAMLMSLVLSAATINDLAVGSWWPDARHRAAYRVLAQIPPGSTVSAGERFFPHLYDRAQVSVFPREVERSEYVFVDGTSLSKGAIGRVPATRTGDLVTLDLSSQAAGRRLQFRVVAEDAGILLLRRTGS